MTPFAIDITQGCHSFSPFGQVTRIPKPHGFYAFSLVNANEGMTQGTESPDDRRVTQT